MQFSDRVIEVKIKAKLLLRYYFLLFFSVKVRRAICSQHLLALFREVIRYLGYGRRPIKRFGNIRGYFYGKNGLEIGGPSAIFSTKSILPIYGIVKNLDNCNYQSETIWEGKINEGLTFNYHGYGIGNQFICEATDLEGIKNESYDFVMSVNVLEHVANPLKALFEWMRVLKNNGVMLLVIPHKQCTFDHNRPITKLDHLIRDYRNEVEEHDLGHLSEILSMHDLAMDPEAGTCNNFTARGKNNFKNRCLHHHVFVTEEAIRMIDYVGLRILFARSCLPWHIIICSQKVTHKSEHEKVENHDRNIRLLDENASWRRLSPFILDKKSEN